MQPIAKQRIDDSVYQQLFNNIRQGVWKSGDKLPSENELCDILKVSRVSVRSALQRLQALGLIEVRRGKGSFVCGVEDLFDQENFDDTIDLTEKDFREIAEVRQMIESASIARLLQRPADLSALTAAYQGMRRAAEDLDVDAFTRNDFVFHLAIIRAAGNERFLQIAKIFREDFHRMLRESNKLLRRDSDNPAKVRKHFQESLVYHAELHDALLANDPGAMDIERRYAVRNFERMAYYYQNTARKTAAKAN